MWSSRGPNRGVRYGPWSTQKSPLKRIAVQVMAALSLAVLFLPAFGPQLDHHFAERRPDHAHVYLGGSVPEHSHFFEGRHVHYHPVSARVAEWVSSHPNRPPIDNVVYLMSDDALGQAPVDLTSRAFQLSPVYAEMDAGPLAFGVVLTNTIPDSVSVVPPRRPPRS